MPVIQNYDPAKGAGFNASDLGADAAAATGRRVGMFYNQLGNATAELGNMKAQTLRSLGQNISSDIKAGGDVYLNYETHQQLNHGTATFAQLTLDADQAWKQFSQGTDPNDTSVAARFNETWLQPQLDKFKEGFTTEDSQNWAQAHADALTKQMYHEVSADMSTRAANAVSENIQKSQNAWTNTAYASPAKVPFLLEQAEHSVEGLISSSPNLSVAGADTVRTEKLREIKVAIVKTGAAGVVATAADPEKAVASYASRYSDLISGAELAQFAKAAKTQAKANLLQDKQIETYQRQQEEHAANDQLTKVMTDNITADADGRLTIKPQALQQTLDIARKYPAAGAAPARAMIDFIQAQQNKDLKAIDNPAVVSDLSTRLFDPNHPTTVVDLMRARTKGDISDHTYSQLNGMVKELEATPLKGPVYEDTMKAVHSTLVLTGVGIPGKDDVGERKFANFIQGFVPQYLAKSRAGTLEPNALDLSDPNSMISKAMSPFRRSLTDRINDYISTLGDKKNIDAAPARITTKAQYDALPMGAHYIGRDGQTYEKRGPQ